MKIIENKHERTKFRLSPFSISSQELFAYLEETSESLHHFKLTTGMWSDEQRFLLEELAELRGNLDKLASPFELELNGVKLTLDKHRAEIKHEDNAEDEALAVGLRNRLMSHTSLVRSAAHSNALHFASAPVLCIFVLWSTQSWTFVPTIVLLVCVLSLNLVLSVLLLWKLAPAAVRYRPRDSFWKRNRDTIVVGCIMLILGLIGRELFSWI